MPVYIVQTSAKLNQKELDKALDICQATNCDTICINAPKITDFKAYDFIADNLKTYKDNNPDIHFTIRNPKDSKLFALPIPEYRFSNIIDIVIQSVIKLFYVKYAIQNSKPNLFGSCILQCLGHKIAD